MHVLLIPSWYKTPHNPIRGSFLRERAHMLKNAGHQVGLLVPPSVVRTFTGLAEIKRFWRSHPLALTLEDEQGLPVYRVNWWGWWASLNPLARGALMSQAFERYVQDHGQPDVLHGHAIMYGGYIASELGRRYHLPVLVTESDPVYVTGIHPLHVGQGYFIRRTAAQAHQLAAVAPLAAALRPYVGQKPITPFDNPVDTDYFQPGPPPPETPFVFSIIGRLVPLKGHRLLLEAFAQQFKGQAARIDIIGKGRLMETLQQQAHSLGIAEQCTFHGYIPREDLPDILQKSHVIVSASSVDTFPNTLLEAMAMGKPVIATRAGGPEYIVNEQTGLLVDYGDVAGLGQALADIRVHYDRYDPQAIRAYCVARFSVATIMRQYEAAYTAAINAKG